MKDKLTVLCVFVLVSFAGSQTSHPLSSKAKTSKEQELIALTRARATALASGDCEGWTKYVSADFRFLEGGGSGNRDSVVKECEAGRNAAGGYMQERVLSDFHVQWIGDTPVVDCLYETVEHFGDITLTETARQVSTFQRRGDSWVTLLAVNAGVTHDPPASKVDVATLDALTGQYVWAGAPGMIDTITRKDDKIYVQTTREATATELIPIDSDIFFIHGSDGDRITFLRDASGKVTGEEVRGSDGQGYRAVRMKGRSTQDLGTLGGAVSNAEAINNHAQGGGFTHTDSSLNSFMEIFSVPSIVKKSQEAATSALEIKISVHDYADVPPFHLAAAEADARRIFGLAGVKTVWLSCSPKLGESEPADCSTVDATHLVVKILSGKTTAHVRYRDDVLGNVLLTDDGVSYFAYAFFDHIEMLEQRLNSPVLGYVLAHEIGHLLLGANTHSVSGIMSSHWNGPELLRISEGNLLFLPNECQKLRERLRLRNVDRRDIAAVSGAPQPVNQRQLKPR